VRPLAVEGLDESLDLAVPARCVGRGEDVAGAELGQCLLISAAVAVDERVVRT
jgi:hypothetical protein